MLYRRFGRTELKMPVFSCGGMRYQFKWQDAPLDEIPEDNQKNLEATIRRSVEAGINHIETARGYGSSERQLGVILPTLPREEMIIQTKVSPNEDPKKFREEFLDSLARLKLDYVDLFSLHGVNNAATLDYSVKPGGCLEVARELQKEGLVRHVGFSTHGPVDVILEAIRTERAGGFDYVNIHWYYIFQRNWPAIEEATRRDMGVFIISPSDKGGKIYAPPPKLVHLCGPLHPMAFNDLFCLLRPEVHTLSIGAARPSDFDIHIEALKMFDRAEDLILPIIERLENAMAEGVGVDFATRYQDGLPEWEDVPGNINIKTILWLRNLAVAYGVEEYAKMRYNLLGNADHWFPGHNVGNAKGAENGSKVDVSPALEKSPFKDEISKILEEAHEMLYTEPKKRESQSDDEEEKKKEEEKNIE